MTIKGFFSFLCLFTFYLFNILSYIIFLPDFVIRLSSLRIVYIVYTVVTFKNGINIIKPINCLYNKGVPKCRRFGFCAAFWRLILGLDDGGGGHGIAVRHQKRQLPSVCLFVKCFWKL